MKTTWDELMRYAPEKEYPLPALERGEQERILNKTMKKLEKTKKRPARPVRTALLAAAIAALLCGTAFAAYTNGWFGFDRLFGEKTALIEGQIASYDETTDVDITQPTYTEEEQAMIDEGTMQVPDIADLSDTGVSAETDDFTFTLESMLVSRNSLYAILRIDAKNDDAAAELAAIPETDGYQKELKRMLWVGAQNNTNFGGFGADHRLEWKNGGMSMEIMQVEGSTAYALLTNIGGEFEPGDRILFDMSHHDQNVDLFEIPVPAQLEQELVIDQLCAFQRGKRLRGQPVWDLRLMGQLLRRQLGEWRCKGDLAVLPAHRPGRPRLHHRRRRDIPGRVSGNAPQRLPFQGRWLGEAETDEVGVFHLRSCPTSSVASRRQLPLIGEAMGCIL